MNREGCQRERKGKKIREKKRMEREEKATGWKRNERSEKKCFYI